MWLASEATADGSQSLQNCTIANSSPPSRATVSFSVTHSPSRRPTSFSKASPIGMAERVVDFLEMIEIEAEHRELVAALDEPQRLLELLAEQRPVRQIGQRVMARHVGNLLLAPASIR